MILLMNVDNENASEIEGTNTQIEGAGILDFELKGNTHQDSYTGKNLLNPNGDATTKNGVTITNNGDGTFTVNGTATTNTSLQLTTDTIILENNTTYTQSVITVSGTQVGGIVPSFKDSNGNITYNYFSDNYTRTTTDTMTLNSYNYYIANGATVNNWTFKVQLEKGPTATEYEKFVGGSPSPSPDFPQQIEVVTGDNTINVHGKNLAKVTNTDIGDTTYSLKISNGLINITTTGSNNSFDLCGGIRTGAWLPTSYETANDYHLTPANQGTYTLSASNVSATITGTANQTLNIYTNQRRIYKAITYNGTIEDNTFTLQQDEYVKSIYVWTNGVTTINKLEFKIQLEENSTATSYAPYQSKNYEINLGNIELCKIGDYQDYIYKENGNWYVAKYIRKIELNISDMNRSDDYPGWSGVPYLNGDYPGLNAPTFPTTRLISNIGGNSNSFGVVTTNTNSILILNKGVWNLTQTQWKTNYPNLIFVLYYAISTPTNTEITDTDLIEQLEAISNSALFDGVNYIDLNSDNLIGSYKITYSTWYQFEKILRSGYNINEDNDRITQKFANGHRKQFVSDYKDCIITLNLDTIDIDTTKEYLRQLKSGPYKYYSLENKEYKTAQFIIEKKPELKVNNSIGDNTDIDEYQVTLLRAGD